MAPRSAEPRRASAVLAALTLLGAGLASGCIMSPGTQAATGLKAFPGAEGFGTDTPGGRGGVVCQVTNLDDAGTGSLRACIDLTGPRVVIFRVAGTITLDTRLEVTNPYLTIAGQTAPGPGGITLRNNPANDKGTMLISTHDVVIRFLRLRPGKADEPGESHDALTIYKPTAHDVVIDHSSLSWASDEVLNTYDGSNRITVSWSIVSEGLDDEEHSKGLLSGGENAHNLSLHHTLFASHVDRCPQISGLSVADIRNNVIYNCGEGSGEGTTLVSSSNGHARVNWVANYYKPGPNSPDDRAEFAVYEGNTGRTQEWYGEDNRRWTPDGDDEARIASDGDWGQVDDPFEAPPVTTTSAAEAFAEVLAEAGASRARDAVDERIVADVADGTGQLIDSQDEVGGYPNLPAGVPPNDRDGDGMGTPWERANGTDPDVADPNGDVNGNGYTNVEDWFNSLAGDPTTAP